MKAHLEYRCRRCGTQARRPADALSSRALTHAELLLAAHECPDGGIGVADLQGATLGERPEEVAPLLADGWVLLGWRHSLNCWELCAATEEHGGVIGWWLLQPNGIWVRHRTSSEVDQSRLPDELWQPPLREGQ